LITNDQAPELVDAAFLSRGDAALDLNLELRANCQILDGVGNLLAR
jgi:hypothetical protein